jgi:hypothetical protein
MPSPPGCAAGNLGAALSRHAGEFPEMWGHNPRAGQARLRRDYPQGVGVEDDGQPLGDHRKQLFHNGNGSNAKPRSDNQNINAFEQFLKRREGIW